MKKLLLLLLNFFSSTGCLKILKFEVPEFTEKGSTASLYCQFQIQSEKLKELDVKWYHNSSSSPLLVWVPHSRAPYIVPTRLSKYLKLGSESSGGVEMRGSQTKVTSQLNISTESNRLAGEYTCKVSTFSQEISLSSALTVYEVPVSFDLDMLVESSRLVVSCKVVGGHPPPLLNLCQKNQQGDCQITPQSQDSQDHEAHTKLVSVFNLESLADTSRFTCAYSLPGTNTSRELSRVFSKYQTQYSYSPRTSSELYHTLDSILIFLVYVLVQLFSKN